MFKSCSLCAESKPISTGFYAKDGRPIARCKECHKAAVSRRYHQNIETARARRRALHKKNPDVKRNERLKFQYGITTAEYDRIFDAQAGVCAICKNPESGTWSGRPKRLAVDHCHETGLVRGLLCSFCNPGLGYFRDNVDLLHAAMEYLNDVASISDASRAS